MFGIIAVPAIATPDPKAGIDIKPWGSGWVDQFN